MPDAHAPPADAAESPLQRRFGYWSGHFVIVASMIGAGILTTSGYTLRDTGNAPALLALWVLGGVMALCGALTVAELATRLPRPGGDYLFVREAFGPAAGFVSGWATVVLGFIAPTAVIAHITAVYLLSPWAAAVDSLPAWLAGRAVPLLASAIVLAVTAIHSRGYRESIRLQAASTLAKVVGLLAIVAAGLLFGDGDWRHLATGGWPSREQMPLLAVGLIYVGYSYSGWNGAGYLAGEIRDPVRLLPRCLISGTLTVTAIYVLVNLMYVYALDPQEMMSLPPGEVEKVFQLAVARLFGPSVGDAVALLLGVGMLASISAYVLTGARVAFAMAGDSAFPSFAGRVHPVTHVPTRATWLIGLASAALVWSGTFLELLDYASVGLALTAALMVSSVFAIRRRRDLPPGYQMPLYPAPPALFLALIAWTVAHTLLRPDRQVPAFLSLTTFAAGIPLARLAQRGKEKAPRLFSPHGCQNGNAPPRP